MKKILVYFGFLFSILVNWQLVSAQSSGQVTIEGKQFKLNGANFYPMVMNYAVEITKQQGNAWSSGYITPYVEYGVNGGPAGNFQSYFFECTSSVQCESDLLNDWLYIKSKGFNTIRVAHFYPRFDVYGLTFGFIGRESSSPPAGPGFAFPVDPFNLTDPGLNFLFDKYEQLMQIAALADMKLIFNMIGEKNVRFKPLPGPDNDELEYYTAFLYKLANRIANSPNKSVVLAYDIWNEPCYTDKALNKSKEEACEIISSFRNAIKSNGETPLITIGTCGSGDVWFYDPAVLKVDFHSLHVYTEFRTFEDKTDPAVQLRAISRVYDELFWFNKISPVPWIIGETGYTASTNLSVQPNSGTDGTLADQANFAQLLLDATCNSGGSGFSWWCFQDGFWDIDNPGANHFGMLERGYATGDPASEKPVVSVFAGYTKPVDVNSCGPSPVDETTLQTYNPALTYFNPFQHPTNPQYTIKGYIYDQDGNPIANAYVGGHTNLGKRDNLPISERISEYQRVFTDNSGYFELIPFDYIPVPIGMAPTNLESELHTFSTTASGAERVKYSEDYWLSNYCSNQMPPANDPTLTWNLKKVNFTYNGEVSNVLVPFGTTRELQAYHQLIVENSTIEAGAFAEIKAPVSVHLKETFHAKVGSETHVFCASTSINCSDYSGYAMEYKVASNITSTKDVKSEFIDLRFIFNSNEEKLRIYPNPAFEYFIVEREGDNAENLEIHNLIGELISKYEFQGSKLMVNCSQLPQGVYMIKSTNSNQVYKFIKQ